MVASQIGIALGGVAGLMLAPPAAGRVLLVPLTTAAAARLPGIAFGHGARLESAGELPGSLVVDGVRARLAMPLLRAGIVMIAAPPGGCGAAADTNAKP